MAGQAEREYAGPEPAARDRGPTPRNLRRGDRGPTSHVASFQHPGMCYAGPGSHIAWRGFSAKHTLSHRSYLPILMCRKHRLENMRRGTRVPHRTWRCSSNFENVTRDRGPTSKGETFDLQIHAKNVHMRMFQCAGNIIHKVRFAGPGSQIARGNIFKASWIATWNLGPTSTDELK